MVCPITYGDHN